MKKIALFSMLLAVSWGQSYEEIYLKKGAAEVIKMIEKNVQSEEFWAKRLEKLDLKYGYYDSDTLVSVIDKNKKRLYLYGCKNGECEQVFDTDVIVGKSGDKLVEGDLKTPIGAYELTRRFVPADPYLGPLAFSLSYPNLLDKRERRNGSGIWIHGYPLNGERTDELKTRGCVALKNDILMQYDKLIDHKISLALIFEGDQKFADANEIGAVFAGIFAWKKAWGKSDIEGYLKFYDKNFMRYDGMSLPNFKAMKRQIFSRREAKRISFSNFSITPYPNIKNERIYRVSFWEDYATANYKFRGKKTLYVKLYKNDMKILVEE